MSMTTQTTATTTTATATTKTTTMVLEVKGGGYAYPGRNGRPGTPILTDVNFRFEGPGVLTILGPNGAGKTTLLRAMLGLMPWTKGASFLDGKDVRDWAQRDFWRRVGYVPQARANAFAPLTLAQLVVLGRSARMGSLATPGDDDWAAADQAMRETGIAHLAERRTTEVSGGQLQLAYIARALAADPECLILDEPESNLDFRNQTLVLEVIERLTAKGLGVVINTHFPAHALRLADRTLLVPRGKPPVFGATRDVMTEESLTELFGVQVRMREVELPEGRAPYVAAVGRTGLGEDRED